jgi:hypothetical protein
MNASPTSGYTLKSLGHDVARNTSNAILKGHGIEPAPERGTNTPWKTFLAAHWDGLVAADFFTVEVLTMGGLVRYVVFFVVKLETRAVEGRRDHESDCAQDHVDRHRPGHVPCAARRLAQVLLPRAA